MGLVRGFNDKVELYTGASTKVTLLTIGDITYGSSRTDIAVKTRASNKVRTIPGMESCPISITILDGTDPADANSVNGFTMLKQMYDAGNPVKMSFGGLVDTFSILSFEIGAPVDDLRSANVQLAPSALTISSYPSAASAAALPGQTSGEGGEGEGEGEGEGGEGGDGEGGDDEGGGGEGGDGEQTDDPLTDDPNNL